MMCYYLNVQFQGQRVNIISAILIFCLFHLRMYLKGSDKIWCCVIGLVGHGMQLRKKRSGYRILVGKPEGKRRLGRSRRRWEDNFKMDLKEKGWERVNWFYLAQDKDSERLLWTRYWALQFHIISGVSELSEELFTSPKFFWRMELFDYIFVNCIWVNTRWQWYSTHLHTNST